MENPLLATSVPRTLEGRSKIFGMELSDVLLLFMNLSIQNLIFGSTGFKIPMVWGTTLVLGFVLFFIKRGKPDGYLQHLGRFLASPSIRHANFPDRFYKKFGGLT